MKKFAPLFALALIISAFGIGRALATPSTTIGLRPCMGSQGFSIAAGNSRVVANDGGPNRIYATAEMFNTPNGGSFGLFELPHAYNCLVDAGTQAQQIPLYCGLNNDGGNCSFAKGFAMAGSAPVIVTHNPGDDICGSTDAGTDLHTDPGYTGTICPVFQP